MGALLSQAVANQLRQVPGFQDPNPSPATLLQQVLNPPGPSLPTWMAPVMENRQLLATSMDPQQAGAANQALMQDAFRAALAFGGADITKEQRAAWEEENKQFRLYPAQPSQPVRLKDQYAPGTRVRYLPLSRFEQSAERGVTNPDPILRSSLPGPTGTIVVPGTAEAGRPASGFTQERLSPQHVAVRQDDSPYWLWRHRDTLEVMPPQEFPIGTPVVVAKEWGDLADHGLVQQPPSEAMKSPGPGWVWVDVANTEAPPRDLKEIQGIQRYKGGTWGAWFRRSDIERSTKRSK